MPTIYLSVNDSNISPEDFETYIADMENIPTWEAKNKLTDFCRHITGLPIHGEYPFASVGVFYKDPGNKIGFRSSPLPKTFAPDVKAEKVVHPNDSHEIIVGDKHTTTAAMTEFYTEKPVAAKGRWWIAALVIAITSFISIITYFNSQKHNQQSGNVQTVQPNNLTESYQLK